MIAILLGLEVAPVAAWSSLVIVLTFLVTFVTTSVPDVDRLGLLGKRRGISLRCLVDCAADGTGIAFAIGGILWVLAQKVAGDFQISESQGQFACGAVACLVTPLLCRRRWIAAIRKDAGVRVRARIWLESPSEWKDAKVPIVFTALLVLAAERGQFLQAVLATGAAISAVFVILAISIVCYVVAVAKTLEPTKSEA